MHMRDLLVEAIERAESVGQCETHGHALCLVDMTTHKPINYTLTECRKMLNDIDNPGRMC